METKKRDWQNVKRQRHERITIRLSEEERRQIEEDAALIGITVGAYVRKIMLDAPVPRQSKRPHIDSQQLGRLLGQIGKIGSNLNQIARAVNRHLPYEQQHLQDDLVALKHTQQQIRKALGQR